MIIYAEGGTTNGEYLTRFKRGAFNALKPVLPFSINWNWTYVSPAFDVIGFVELVILLLACGQISTCITKRYPLFVPNEYLFKTHADKGKDKAEIYAWAVEQIVRKGGGFKKNEQAQRDKFIYKNFMYGKRKDCQWGDKVFTWPPQIKHD